MLICLYISIILNFDSNLTRCRKLKCVLDWKCKNMCSQTKSDAPKCPKNMALNKCALVRNQPNTSLRPTHPVRPLRSARLYPQTSISTGSPFQPPRGTFTPHNTHQETEKMLDIWCDKLRCGHWTNTWSNNTTNSALAYRELCTVFSDC